LSDFFGSDLPFFKARFALLDGGSGAARSTSSSSIVDLRFADVAGVVVSVSGEENRSSLAIAMNQLTRTGVGIQFRLYYFALIFFWATVFDMAVVEAGLPSPFSRTFFFFLWSLLRDSDNEWVPLLEEGREVGHASLLDNSRKRICPINCLILLVTSVKFQHDGISLCHI
jgi:hypothetical protein